MESVEFIEQLKTLVANENPLAVSNEVNDLRAKFNDFVNKQSGEKGTEAIQESKDEPASDEHTMPAEKVAPTEEIILTEAPVSNEESASIEHTIPAENISNPEESTAQEAPISAEESDSIEHAIPEEKSTPAEETISTEKAVDSSSEGETSEDVIVNSSQEEFYAIYNEYKAKKKAVIDARNATETVNLQAKKALISELSKIVTTEENIGSAFAGFKEIQEKWKAIGDIPRANRNDIQAEYSKLLEDFFYNIKIYKELKDHDFHRNYQLKMEVIEKLKTLIGVKSIKDVETQLKSIQNEWEDIGPVPNEKWEEVKDAYWTEVRSSYERINRFYDDRRLQQQENLKKKEELLAEAKEMAAKISEFDSTKAWEESTALVLDIQKRWKTVGFGPKKENEEIWKAFRGTCDEFFNAKKEFYSKVNEVFDGVAQKKQALIDKALSLKESTDWKETSNQLIQLQKQWKTLGHAGRKNEQKLWKAFRAACDGFFNNRQSHFGAQDKENEDNLVAKEALLKEIEAIELPADKSEALNVLKEASAKFNAIGRVPMKSKDAIFKGFKNVMDKHYGDLKLEGEEKERVLFQAKIDTALASPDASNVFYGMKQDLRKDIDKQQKEISLLENNLGFFANSKGADALKKDVEKKVNRAKEKVAEIKRKLKMIPNE